MKYLSLTILTILAFTVISTAQVDRNLVRDTASPQTAGRTALVIGNGTYADSPLKNPPNDATDIAAALKLMGFEVLAYTNLNQTGMKRAIREFGTKLRAKGGVGLFYYAGHGVQVKGTNYLIPIGAAVNSEEEVEYEAVEAGLALAQMEAAKNALNIVILDACRNNPFARSFRSGDKGLASIDAPSGTLIAYSTAPGSVASDGTGRNGLYTQELLKRLKTDGLSIEEVFKQVRISVRQETSDKQTPWEVSSLTGDFYFTKGGGTSSQATSVKSKVATRQSDDDPLAELEAWNKVKSSAKASDYFLFIQKYPEGRFTEQARSKMNEIGDPDWNSIRGTQDAFKLREYIKKNPNSPFLDDAKAKYERLATDEIAWNMVGDIPSAPKLATYLSSFPNGTHSEEAKKKLAELDWAELGSRSSADDYLTFSRKHPASIYAEKAKNLAVEKAWEAASASPTDENLTFFINKYPESSHIPQANKLRLESTKLLVLHAHKGWGGRNPGYWGASLGKIFLKDDGVNFSELEAQSIDKKTVSLPGLESIFGYGIESPNVKHERVFLCTQLVGIEIEESAQKTLLFVIQYSGGKESYYLSPKSSSFAKKNADDADKMRKAIIEYCKITK